MSKTSTDASRATRAADHAEVETLPEDFPVVDLPKRATFDQAHMIVVREIAPYGWLPVRERPERGLALVERDGVVVLRPARGAGTGGVMRFYAKG